MGAVDVHADVGCHGALLAEPLAISNGRGEKAARSKLSGPDQQGPPQSKLPAPQTGLRQAGRTARRLPAVADAAPSSHAPSPGRAIDRTLRCFPQIG
jgi:hypothetical protein